VNNLKLSPLTGCGTLAISAEILFLYLQSRKACGLFLIAFSPEGVVKENCIWPASVLPAPAG